MKRSRLVVNNPIDLIHLRFDKAVRKVRDRSRLGNLWVKHDRIGAIEDRLLTSLFDESGLNVTTTNDRCNRLKVALFDKVSCSRVYLLLVCKFKGKVGPVDHDRVLVNVQISQNLLKVVDASLRADLGDESLV